MIIGIDASRLTSEQATGVEHYSWQIIKGILSEVKSLPITKRPEIVLYSREKLPSSVMEWKVEAKNEVIYRRRFWTILGLASAMRKMKKQTLFVPSHTLPPSLPMRSVITIHDVAFRYLRKSYSFMQFHYLNLSTKFAVRRATKIIVPSEATKKDLVNFYNCEAEKIEVVYHGFARPEAPKDEDKGVQESAVFRDFGLNEKSKYILFVGRLESKKNLVRLVEAFKEFSGKHENYYLVLAGKRGHGFKHLLDKVKQLEILDQVIMPGYITEEEKFLLYKYCAFFAFPSLYEGFGFPVLEAFFHEKAVLCSSISSLPEVGGEAVEYCDPYDKNSIKDGLISLAKNDAHCEELKKLGSEQLKKFTWEKAAKQTLDILWTTQK